jgi:hypothetical protein
MNCALQQTVTAQWPVKLKGREADRICGALQAQWQKGRDTILPCTTSLASGPWGLPNIVSDLYLWASSYGGSIEEL